MGKYNSNNKFNEGLTVEVRNGNVDQALRKFKKKLANDGKLQEVRDRREFTPNCEIKKKRKAAAKARWKKHLSSQVQPKRLF
jgi:ribosomal protein S21